MQQNWKQQKSRVEVAWEFLKGPFRLVANVLRPPPLGDLVVEHDPSRERAALILTLVIVFSLGACAGSLFVGRLLKSRIATMKEMQSLEMSTMRRNTRDQVSRVQTEFELVRKGMALQKEQNNGAVTELQTIKNEQHVLSAEIQQLRSKLTRAEMERERIEKEREDVEKERTRVEKELDLANAWLFPFQQRASELYTNELPVEALNKLYSEIQPDTFEVRMNGLSVTNHQPGSNVGLHTLQPVNLTGGSAFTISVTNTGKFPMKGLTVLCYAEWLVQSNIVTSAGWGRPGLRAVSFSGADKLMVLWRTRATAATPDGETFVTPPIILRSALALEKPLPILVQVFSERSDTKDFWLNLRPHNEGSVVSDESFLKPAPVVKPGRAAKRNQNRRSIFN